MMLSVVNMNVAAYEHLDGAQEQYLAIYVFCCCYSFLFLRLKKWSELTSVSFGFALNLWSSKKLFAESKT